MKQNPAGREILEMPEPWPDRNGCASYLPLIGDAPFCSNGRVHLRGVQRTSCGIARGSCESVTSPRKEPS